MGAQHGVGLVLRVHVLDHRSHFGGFQFGHEAIPRCAADHLFGSAAKDQLALVVPVHHALRTVEHHHANRQHVEQLLQARRVLGDQRQHVHHLERLLFADARLRQATRQNRRGASFQLGRYRVEVARQARRVSTFVSPKAQLHGAEQVGIRPHHPPRQEVNEERESQRQRRAHQHHHALHAQHRPQRSLQVLHHQHAPAEGRRARPAAQLSLRHQRRPAGRAEAEPAAGLARRTGCKGAQGLRVQAHLVFDQRPAVAREYRDRKQCFVTDMRQHFVASAAEPVQVQFGEQQPLHAAGRVEQRQADIEAEARRLGAVGRTVGGAVDRDSAAVAERHRAGRGREQGPVRDRLRQCRDACCGAGCGACCGQHLAACVSHGDHAVHRRDLGQPLKFAAHHFRLVQVSEGRTARQQLQLGGAALYGARHQV